jgi:hypothetical protein
VQISGSNPALNTLRLSLTSESQRASLLGRLSEGDTIQARVVDELSTGRWAIRFMGHTLVAESRLALKPGQVVDTRIQDLGPPLMLSISGRPGSETAAVDSALHRLGLKNDATSRAILAGLIRSGLPVERSEVQALREFLTGLGDTVSVDDLNELVDRILFLRSKGLPVTPDTISAFFSSAPSGTLGALLEGLADLLKGLDRKLAPEMRDRLTGILRELPSGDKLTPEALRQTLLRMGLDLESRIGNETATDTLRAVLLQLQSSTDLSPGESDQIATLLRFLNTSQAAALPGDGGDPIAFQIPFAEGPRMSTADIEISRGGKNGEVDPSRVTVTVTVNLTELGLIRIDLSSYEGRNSCRIRVEDQSALDHLSSQISGLTDGLSRSGYPVSEIQLHLDQPNGQSAPPSPRIGVDFKA